MTDEITLEESFECSLRNFLQWLDVGHDAGTILQVRSGLWPPPAGYVER